jgi:hypothetical protein
MMGPFDPTTAADGRLRPPLLHQVPLPAPNDVDPFLRDEAVALMRSAGAVGTATHRLIALCALLAPRPDPALILKVAERHLPKTRNTNTRQALLTACTSMAAVYFRRYRMAGMELEAVEEAVGGVRLDLLWRSEGGRLVADEVKTGVFSWPSTATRGQAIREVRAARERFGPDFDGVRVVPIRSGAAPCFFASKDWY